MAIHDKKDPLILKDQKAAPKEAPKKEAKKEDEIGYSASSVAPKEDKEHIKRHNEAEQKDKKLAAMLQANWAMRVNAEHKPH